MSADAAAVRCRGVRGATFIDEDTPGAILAGTRELLAAIARANGIATEDIASAFFTSTALARQHLRLLAAAAAGVQQPLARRRPTATLELSLHPADVDVVVEPVATQELAEPPSCTPQANRALSQPRLRRP